MSLVDYNSSFVPRPFGLANYSAICWFNSCVQCLVSLPSFNSLLINNRQTYLDANNRFAIMFSDFIAQLGLNGDKVSGQLNVHALGNQLVVQANRPHDLVNGASCANSAIVAIQDIISADELFGVSTSTEVTCISCNHTVAVRDHNQYFRMDEFIGTTSADEFRDHIRQSLSTLTDYKCSLCGFIGAKKKTDLRRLNTILVIPFQSKTYRKYSQWFPEELSFPTPNGNTMKYILCGIVEHNGGHYWAHVKRDDMEWYIANDSSFSKDKYECNDHSFILFYHYTH